ncbi:MAG: TlpA family protein disulfide reductase [Chloroflexi bacterium]|nr:MAG: TlpA family protein disulfide reductase [Chloroflexota bacterium]
MPVLAIAVIVGAIWWLENRHDEGRSSSGEEYGPRDLAAALVPPGMDVGTEEGRLAPNSLLETLDGKEIPELVAAYNFYRERGLVILGVNLQEGKGIVRPFAEEFGMNFPILIDRDGEVGDEFRILGLPTTYFVDRGGVVRSIFTGPFIEKGQGSNVQGAIEENELQKRIEEVLT